MTIEKLISELKADELSVQYIADYLGYDVGSNPVDPDGPFKMLFTDKIPDKSLAVLALKSVPELTLQTNTPEIRKLYQQVKDLEIELGASFDTELVGFVGHQRLIIFRLKNGNRDERLDINSDTAKKPLYQDNFHQIKNTAITAEEDDFFGQYEIRGLENIFKRELTTHFLQMVALYRKTLSELLVSHQVYKEQFKPLVSENAKHVYIPHNQLVQLIDDPSFISALSSVVDTLILRQLMRRFLEGYYGKEGNDPFAVQGIALGIGKGTLDEAIQEAVEVYGNLPDETTLKKINKEKSAIQAQPKIEVFVMNFDQKDLTTTKVGRTVTLKENSKDRLKELQKIATEQFKAVYGGDLFASSVGVVTDKIETLIVKHHPDFWAKFWLDTSSELYSFRYEDVPPEALERQYENSMSQNVQISINEEGQPYVYYGDDLSEQKTKGAYYTDERFVTYMVEQALAPEFQKRIAKVKNAIKLGENPVPHIKHLLDLKVADLTAGGGSFLRGAFRFLASKHDALSGLKLGEKIQKQFPMFERSDEGIRLWEEHILHHMVYGVDYDYKAILISSLTLMLSSLQHRPGDKKLPELIGKTLIHQNSLMNSVPYYQQAEIFEPLASEIKKLLKYKQDNSPKFEELKAKLQKQVAHHAGKYLKEAAYFLHVQSLELNLPEVFFNEDGTLKENPGFDCILGNPPWEGWLPKSDEFYNQYDSQYLESQKKSVKDAIQKELHRKFPHLESKWKEIIKRFQKGSEYFRADENYRFQSWIVGKKKTASHLNLYKLSVERFYQLLKDGQCMSILIQDSLMTDLGSTGLRHLIFDQSTLKEWLSFENRKNIFQAIDNRIKFAVLTLDKEWHPISTFKAFFYKQTLESLQNENEKLDYPLKLIVEAEPEKYSMFTPHNQNELDFYQKLKLKYPPLGESKLLKMTSDYNRTNGTPFFKKFENGDTPLYGGVLIEQFQIRSFPIEGVKTEIALAKVGEDLHEYRITYRDVTNATNRRTIIATLLPPNSVTVHTLWVQKEASKMSINSKLFYLAILNSYALDFMARKLVDKHLSQTLLNQLPLPPMNDFQFQDDLVQITKELLLLNGEPYHDLSELVEGSSFSGLDFNQLVAELNARVAIGFDLTRPEVINLLKTFESANHKSAVQAEAQRILDVYDRLKLDTELEASDALQARLDLGLPSIIQGFTEEQTKLLERFEVIDNRHKPGALWVVAPETETSLRKLGFTFSPRGGKATNKRPAWWRN